MRSKPDSSPPPLFPKCDGVDFATRVRAPDTTSEIKHEFLLAYHRINQAYAELAQARNSRLHQGLGKKEKKLLRALETAIQRKEELEDRYSPLGIWASPELENGIVTNVRFTFPTRRLSMFFTVRSEQNPANCGPQGE